MRISVRSHILNPGFQKHSVFLVFVPILNVVSTASADILDTIQCFCTLLSLATPNREMFFTQIHLVNDSKKLRLRRAKIDSF